MRLRTAILSAIVALLFVPVQAQREGHVWFFGDSLLMDFNVSPPKVTKGARLWAWEASSSMCGRNGNLEMYASHRAFFDSNNDTVPGWYIPNSLYTTTRTITNGVQLVRMSDSLAHGFTIHPDGFMELLLKWHRFRKVGGEWQVDFLDSLVLADVTEKQLAIRHSNGEDWWLLLHENWTNGFFKILLDETGVVAIDTQYVGSTPTNFNAGILGQMDFHYPTNRLAYTGGEGIIDLYEFDRCSGMLSPQPSILKDTTDKKLTYGVCFSPSGRFLYVFEDSTNFANYESGILLQFDLWSSDITGSEYRLWESGNLEALGGLKRGPDNLIYIAHWDEYPNPISRHLFVIRSPDSLHDACQLDSIDLYPYKVSIGMPAIPDYTIGPEYYAAAQAGERQLICLGDSVQIGANIDVGIGKMIWSWTPTEGLSNPNAARPMASPSVPTVYYLYATDTTMNPNCATTVDSVVVVVGDCPVPYELSISPNPAPRGAATLHIQGLYPGVEVEMEVFDALGKRVSSRASYGNGDHALPTEGLAMGVYYVRLFNPNGGVLRVERLVVGR